MIPALRRLSLKRALQVCSLCAACTLLSVALPAQAPVRHYTAAQLVNDQTVVFLYLNSIISYETLIRYTVGHFSEDDLERRKRLYILSEVFFSAPPVTVYGSHHVGRQKSDPAPSYTFQSSTPSLPFVGNTLVIADPLSLDQTGIALAGLRRLPDCSLTETIVQPGSGALDATTIVELPNVQDYLHTVSGLTTTPDAFPRGCDDTALGKRSVGTAMPIGPASGNLTLTADLDPSSEQLRVQAINRVTKARTTTALTTGRVRSFVVADINGDGLNDIVAAGVGYGFGASGSVVTYLNNGDGTFRIASTVASNGSTFTIDDIDGDGKPDILIDNGSDGNGMLIPGVTTMLGNGDGTFRAPRVSAASTAFFTGPFITGDFNGDGKPDLLTASGVLIGVGDGTFVAGPVFPASVQIGLTAAVGDLDRDGKLDVVYGDAAGFVQVLHGNGDGSFTIGARYASLPNGQAVAVTDIDGDGNLDIVVGNSSQGLFANDSNDGLAQQLQVLLGRGDGTFVGAPVMPGTYQTNTSAPQLAAADVDGDGKLDAIVIDNTVSNGITVLPGIGNGAFGAGIHSTSIIHPSMVVTADLNGDGKPDLVAAGTSASALPIIATFLNQGGSRFAAEHDYALPNDPKSIVVGDFDGDGRIDVAVAVSGAFGPSGPSGVYVLYGQSDGTLAAPVLVDASVTPVGLAAADVNLDGRTDLAVADFGASGSSGAVHLYLGRGDRTFTSATVPATTATRYTAIAFGDLDGDGRPDLLAGGSVPGTSVGVVKPNLYLFHGNGDGTFAAPTTEPLLGKDGNGANAIAVGSFSNNGHLDVAVGNQADYTEVLLSTADGTFGHSLIALGQRPGAIVVADLDNDRFAELLVGISGVGTAVFKNVGTMAAWSPTTTAATPPTGPTPPTAGDFTLSASPTSGSVVAGQSVQTTIAAMPSGGYSGTVSLSCTAGLPAGATCAFSPSALALSGTAASSSALTITTKAATAIGLLDLQEPGWPAGLAVTAFGSVSLLSRRRRARRGLLFGILALATALASCGGDNGTSGGNGAGATAGTLPATAPVTYNVTITATGTNATHTATYALTLH